MRAIPGSNRKALYLGAHASHIVEMLLPEGRLALRDLTEHATSDRRRGRRPLAALHLRPPRHGAGGAPLPFLVRPHIHGCPPSATTSPPAGLLRPREQSPARRRRVRRPDRRRLPGFTVTTALVQFLPVTFNLSPVSGLTTMLGILVGGMSGGLSAVVLVHRHRQGGCRIPPNAPPEPAAATRSPAPGAHHPS
jgi:hypothetical protein